MSEAAVKDLSGGKLQQLLAAVKSNQAAAKDEVQASDYNWQEPHHFNGEQLKKLSQFADKTAEMIDKHLSGLFGSSIKVEIVSTSQHFGGDMHGQILDAKEKDYYLSFSDEQNNPSGFMVIPAGAVFSWVSQLLGDAQEEQDTNQTLSQLEESLLLDIASAVVNAVGDSLKSSGGIGLQRMGDIVYGECPIVLSPIEELWKATFQVEQSEKKVEGSIIMLSRTLEPVAGVTARRGAEASPQENSERIRQNLERVLVGVEGRLGGAWPVLRDIVDLEPGDILLLDTKIDEPIEVVVEGRVLFRGRAAKSSGKYAVVITGAAESE